ncbi:MAG: CoA ester lyase [Kineosporiaceae bacterium]
MVNPAQAHRRPARARRCVLAVPGSNPRMIDKARGVDVDAVFLDLEDAVAPDAKEAARAQVAGALRDGGFAARLVAVRVNGWHTPFTVADVQAVVGSGVAPGCIVLPKVSRPEHVVALALVLGQVEHAAGLPAGTVGIEAQIEDAAALLAAPAIAAASPRLESLVFGPGDFLASLGMRTSVVGAQPTGYDADAYHHPLMAILVAARAAGVQAVDGPWSALGDDAGLRRSAGRSAGLGYDGKWAIHPAQVEAVTEAFTPSADEVAAARALLDAYALATSASGGATGAIRWDGQMLDDAGRAMAAAVLARAGLVG